MNFTHQVGKPSRITSTGVLALTSANAVLLGVGCGAVLTAQLVQLWAGSATGTPILGTLSLAANTFVQIPAWCAGGITYCNTIENPDLTIYWNPAGGV